jgi:hypothetical protein
LLISHGLDPGPELLAERLDVREDDEVVQMTKCLGSWEVSINPPLRAGSKENPDFEQEYARMKHHKIRYHSKNISPRRSLSTQRLSKIVFPAFSANSAVNTYVSFWIKLATSAARGGADTSIRDLRILRRRCDFTILRGETARSK